MKFLSFLISIVYALIILFGVTLSVLDINFVYEIDILKIHLLMLTVMLLIIPTHYIILVNTIPFTSIIFKI